MNKITDVGVVGFGLMGTGIAEVCARNGLKVVIVEENRAQAETGRTRLEASLKRSESRGRLIGETAEQVLQRITVAADLDALASHEFVIEAITEDETAKIDLFRRLDHIVQTPEAILASNTSSIPIMKLGVVTGRASQVLGIHFFNPVPVLPLVELVPSLLTSDSTLRRAQAFVRDQLGKTTIGCQDRAGFVVNALLIPFVLSAIRMLESGFATAEDIDQGLVLGAAHPQGPLALADLIGLDTTKAVAESLYGEFKEPLYAPPPLLARMVDAGLLGRKTGRGFYTYDTPLTDAHKSRGAA